MTKERYAAKSAAIAVAVGGLVAVSALTAHAGSTAVVNVPSSYLTWIQQSAKTCPTITAPLLAAQIEQESNWDPKAVSSIGAEGISQFLPGTWAAFGGDADKDGVNSPFDPPDGIMAQGRYMCHLVGETASVPGDKVRVLLWAYNAGPEATKNSAGKAPTAEAEHYANWLLGELVPKYTP